MHSSEIRQCLFAEQFGKEPWNVRKQSACSRDTTSTTAGSQSMQCDFDNKLKLVVLLGVKNEPLLDIHSRIYNSTRSI